MPAIELVCCLSSRLSTLFIASAAGSLGDGRVAPTTRKAVGTEWRFVFKFFLECSAVELAFKFTGVQARTSKPDDNQADENAQDDETMEE